MGIFNKNKDSGNGRRERELQEQISELIDKNNKLGGIIQELANKYEVDYKLAPLDSLTSGFIRSNLVSELMVLVDALVSIHPEVKKDPFVEDYYQRLDAFAKDTEEYRKERKDVGTLLDKKYKEI